MMIPTLFFLLLQLRQKTSSKYKKSKVNKKNPLKKKTQKTTHPKQKTTTIVVVLEYGKNKILHTTIVDAKKSSGLNKKKQIGNAKICLKKPGDSL